MCGLYGVYFYGKGKCDTNLRLLVEELAQESTVRGTHATGIAYLHNGEMVIDKAPENAYKFNGYNKIPFDVKVVIGHTRHTTQGSEKKNFNNHPFYGVPNKRQFFALAHNGVLDNDFELKKLYNLPETEIETDSYVAVQLIEHKGKINMDSVKWMAEQVEGMFTFTILDHKNRLYVVKNDSPFHIVRFNRLNMYVYASTMDILHNALMNFRTTREIIYEILQGKRSATEELEYISPTPGQILLIKPNGVIEYEKFTPQDRVTKYRNRHLKYAANGGNQWSDQWDYWYYRDYRDLSYTRSVAPASTASRTENKNCNITDNWYLEYLRNYAHSMGYDRNLIDRVRNAGYTFEEIEEALYTGTLGTLV